MARVAHGPHCTETSRDMDVEIDGRVLPDRHCQEHLPNELMVLVFSFLPCAAARVASMVSRQWAAVSDSRVDSCVSLSCLYDHESNPCDWAAGRGHIECIEWARSRGYAMSAKTCANAAKGGHVAALAHLHESGCPWNYKTTVVAEAYYHIECLAYAHTNGCFWAKYVIPDGNPTFAQRTAAHGEHLADRMIAFIRYANQNRHRPPVLLFDDMISAGVACYDRVLPVWIECGFKLLHTGACLGALRKGDADAAAALFASGVPWTAACCLEAARRGFMDLVRCVHTSIEGCREKNTAHKTMSGCTEATSLGLFDLAAEMHRSGCTVDFDTCRFAARAGRLDLLDYGLDSGIRLDDVHWSEATAARGLDAVDHAVRRGVPPNAGMVCGAVRIGSIKLVDHLVQLGAPLTPDALVHAAAQGNADIIRRLRERYDWALDRQGCIHSAIVAGRVNVLDSVKPGSAVCRYGGALDKAARAGHLAVLVYVHTFGHKWGSDMCTYAARGGHLACVQFMRDRGAHWDARTCEAAAADGHLDLLCYLRQQKCPWDVRTYRAACQSRHDPTIAHVWKNGCPRV